MPERERSRSVESLLVHYTELSAAEGKPATHSNFASYVIKRKQMKPKCGEKFKQERKERKKKKKTR